MNRRNLTTAAMAVGAVVLLYAGVAMAREPERAPVLNGVAPRASLVANDRSGEPSAEPVDDRGVAVSSLPAASDGRDDAAGARRAAPNASPDDRGQDGLAPEPGDDRGGDASRTTVASPMATADDHGNDGLGPTTAPTASSDDHGNDGAAPTATASPDDHGGASAGAGTPTPMPTASDDHGGGGSDG